MKKIKLKLILTSLIGLVCVSATCFSITFAWFTINRSTEAFTNAISIQNPANLNIRVFGLKKNYVYRDADNDGRLEKCYTGYTSKDIDDSDFTNTPTGEITDILDNYCEELKRDPSNYNNLLDGENNVVNSIENMFGTPSGTGNNNLFNGNFYPGKKFTFIFEITSNTEEDDTVLSMTIKDMESCTFGRTTEANYGSGSSLVGPTVPTNIVNTHPISDAISLGVGWCMGDDHANGFPYAISDVFRDFCRRNSEINSFEPPALHTAHYTEATSGPKLKPKTESYYDNGPSGSYPLQRFRYTVGGEQIPVMYVNSIYNKTYVYLNFQFRDDSSTYVNGSSNVYLNQYLKLTLSFKAEHYEFDNEAGEYYTQPRNFFGLT